MSKCILHGVGRLILKDFADPSKIISYSNLQQFTLESTFSTDDITGGNKMFPIASFKTETAVNCTARDAMFDAGIFPYLDGGEAASGAQTMTDFKEVTIPSTKSVTLDVESPSNVTVSGMTKADSEPTAGQFKVQTNTVTFAQDDVGKVVTIVYEYQSGANATSYGITEKSMGKPFVAVYVSDIYNEDSQIMGHLNITIYKAQCTSGLNIDMSHQTAFAPEFSFSARDPKREDGKLWDFTFDEVEQP